MRLVLLINKMCIAASIACLGTAFLLAGYGLILLAFSAMAFFWLLQKRQPLFWSTSTLLVAYLFLAIVGVGLHLPAFLLAAGCTAALAGWDLTNFAHRLANQPPETGAPLEQNHLRSLAVAAGLSLMLVFISAQIHLQIPFLATVLLALVATGGLTYGLRLLTKGNS